MRTFVFASVLALITLAGCSAPVTPTKAAPLTQEQVCVELHDEGLDKNDFMFDAAGEYAEPSVIQDSIDKLNEIEKRSDDDGKALVKRLLDPLAEFMATSKEGPQMTASVEILRETEIVRGICKGKSESEATKAALPKLTPKDFDIKVRIKRQKCFGPAGCNVTIGIDPSYTGFATVYNGSWDITYEIEGLTSPIINTMTLEDGQISYTDEESAETAGPDAEITARVTDVVLQ